MTHKRAQQQRQLAIVLSHPIQYYSPWFRWLAKHTDLSFRVFYLWDFGVTSTRDKQFNQTFAWDVELLSGYSYEFVPNVAPEPGSDRFWGLQNPTLLRRLRAYGPSAILLFGYKYATHVRLLCWARLTGIPVIFRGDSHLIGRERLNYATHFFLRVLYAQFSAVTYVGEANRQYFLSAGVSSARLFFSPHSVDAQLFDVTVAKYHKEAEELKATLGLKGRRVLLFAGKFASAKQPLRLLHSYLKIYDNNSALVFVGDGDQKMAIEEEIARHPHACIRLLPFTNQSEMPSRYLLADAFILPSIGNYETWGLAVNEAMLMGIPCIVSDHVGCQRDLVTDTETGWVFRADDQAELCSKLKHALEQPEDETNRMRENIRQRISSYTYEAAASGLVAALGSVE